MDQQESKYLHGKDLINHRAEYLKIIEIITSNLSNRRTNNILLLLTWTVLYTIILTQINLNPMLNGHFIISLIVIFILGIFLLYITVRIAFYSIVSNFLVELKYHEINMETIKELSLQNIFNISFEKWQNSWNKSDNLNWLKTIGIVLMKPFYDRSMPLSVIKNYIILGILITFIHIISAIIWNI